MGQKHYSENRKAFHNYSIFEKFEAGLVLQGTEVKSIRAGKVNLSDGWVDLDYPTATLRDVHISPYNQGNRFNHPEKRDRRLLMHEHQIAKLARAVEEKGFTVVPLRIYAKDRWIKVEIALAKGKKLHDKRATSREKEANRDVARAMKQRR